MLVMGRPAAISRPRGPAVTVLTDAWRAGADNRLDRQHQPVGEDVTLPRVELIRHRWRLVNRAADTMSSKAVDDGKTARPHRGLDRTADRVDLGTRTCDCERCVKRIARARRETRCHIRPRSDNHRTRGI